MRKIIYSGALKFIAVLLCVACIVLGTLTASAGVLEFYSEEESVYSFERDFSESWYLAYLLNEPEWAVVSVYEELMAEYSISGANRADFIKRNTGKIAECIKERFSEFFYEDRLDYYIEYNGTVITNCGAVSAEELWSGEHYSFVRKDASGAIERSYTARHVWSSFEGISYYDNVSDITVATRLKDEAATKYERIWERQEAVVIDTVLYTGAFALAALLLLVYLICVCGKRADGECKNMWIDNVFFEVHLAFTGAALAGGIAVCVIMVDEYLTSHLPVNVVYAVAGITAGAVSFIVITSLLSAVRNIKTGRFVKTSLILRVIVWLWRLLVKMLKWTWRKTKALFATIKRALSKKAGALTIVALFFYTALIGFLGVITPHSPIGLILGVLLFLFASFVVACRGNDLDAIKNGTRQIRSGNTAYKIPAVGSSDMKELSDNINDIASGVDEAVAAKVKAERMRSELITNVSHDLKTPITSIISYAELLSKEELSDEARDYVAVISKKGDRLKRLTQDLFDISKAHSGNDEAVLERLDASLLLEQALAEHEREIEASGLVFCTQIEKELFVEADGRKMSRVLGNLIDNVLKYTLKSTRIFVSAAKKDGGVEIEFKNVSAYPLTFDAEEITSRFVRGDESRTKEGNGLGLAIAKSYTELCGGAFSVVLDGDVFKAIISFKTV